MPPAQKSPRSLNVPHRSVQGDGSMLVVAELSDPDGRLAYTFSLTFDAECNLRVLCKVAPGSPPLSGFQAWQQ